MTGSSLVCVPACYRDWRNARLQWPLAHHYLIRLSSLLSAFCPSHPFPRDQKETTTRSIRPPSVPGPDFSSVLVCCVCPLLDSLPYRSIFWKGSLTDYSIFREWHTETEALAGSVKGKERDTTTVVESLENLSESVKPQSHQLELL